MDGNITINIVEPGTPPSPTPIDPVVPNTGLFTSGIGGPEATAIGVVLILTIAAIVVAFLYRKQKKSGKVTKLVHIIDSTKAVLKSKKRVTAGLSAMALLASAGTLTTLLTNTGKSNTNAINGETTAEAESITPIVSNNELTVELGSEPVFAVLPVDITVEEATAAGYTLTAYTDNTDLVSTTDSSKVIPMVAASEGELVALTDNTYGLSLVKPESKDEEVYTTLSTDADNPTFITDKDYEATETNDTTTIYYGFYITPDTPYGTYMGSDINYTVEANRSDLATVTFDSNGLYFDNNQSNTTNVVRYEKTVTDKTEVYSHTPNVDDEGNYTEYYPVSSNKTFVYSFADAAHVTIDVIKTGNDSCCGPDTGDYFSFWPGSNPGYTALTDWDKGVKLSGSDGKYVFAYKYDGSRSYSATVDSNALTVAYTTSDRRGTSTGTDYGLGYYAKITATDADGNPAYAIGNSRYSGTYKTPATEQYDNYEFLGWSLDPNATSALFTDAADVEANLSLGAGEKATLYAVWSPVVNISYDGDNATAGSMKSTSYNGDEPTTVTLAHESVIVGDTIDLYAPNYKKTGYGFAGWSTDENAWDNLTDDDEGNDPTIYGPNETFTMTKDVAIEAANGKDTLYAVWAPAETDAQGSPVSLQNWQGCSSLTVTTYDTETGKLTVGKNTLTALTDSRDGEVYTIARLADGNCWMTENLRLDNDATISTTNTHNPITVDNNVAIKNNDGNTSNHLSPNSNSWCTGWGSADCYNQSYLNTFNTNLGGEGAIASYNGGYDNEKAFQWYSYGNNYNWYSATAGNGTYSTGEQGAETVAGDVCPAGWILPIGNETTENGSFWNLNVQMGSKQYSEKGSRLWRSFPNNFVYSGVWGVSSAGDRGDYGYYWSSAANDTSRAYFLDIRSGGVYPGTSSDVKSYGYSVRCVAPVEQ